MWALRSRTFFFLTMISQRAKKKGGHLFPCAPFDVGGGNLHMRARTARRAWWQHLLV